MRPANEVDLAQRILDFSPVHEGGMVITGVGAGVKRYLAIIAATCVHIKGGRRWAISERETGVMVERATSARGPKGPAELAMLLNNNNRYDIITIVLKRGNYLRNRPDYEAS